MTPEPGIVYRIHFLGGEHCGDTEIVPDLPPVYRRLNRVKPEGKPEGMLFGTVAELPEQMPVTTYRRGPWLTDRDMIYYATTLDTDPL